MTGNTLPNANGTPALSPEMLNTILNGDRVPDNDIMRLVYEAGDEHEEAVLDEAIEALEQRWGPYATAIESYVRPDSVDKNLWDQARGGVRILRTLQDRRADRNRRDQVLAELIGTETEVDPDKMRMARWAYMWSSQEVGRGSTADLMTLRSRLRHEEAVGSSDAKQTRAELAGLERILDAAVARDMPWFEVLYDADPSRVDPDDRESFKKFHDAYSGFVRIGRSVQAAGEVEALLDRTVEFLAANPDRRIAPQDVSQMKKAFEPVLRYRWDESVRNRALERSLDTAWRNRVTGDALAGVFNELRPVLADTRDVILPALADKFLEQYKEGAELNATSLFGLGRQLRPADGA